MAGRASKWDKRCGAKTRQGRPCLRRRCAAAIFAGDRVTKIDQDTVTHKSFNIAIILLDQCSTGILVG